MLKYIVVSGNPIDGLFFNGPFEERDDAVTWAGINLNDNWWIAELESQDNYDH